MSGDHPAGDAPPAASPSPVRGPGDRPGAGPGAELADGQERPVAPRAVALWRLTGFLRGLVVALACLVVLALLLTYRPLGPLLTGPAMVAVAVLAGVQLVLAVLWPPLSYRRLRWRLDAAGLHLRRGVLWRSDITVPRSRVQHTDVSQGPFARLFGLASLVVYTAGTEHSEVALPGLRHATACAIRDFLIAAGADEDR